MKDGLLFIIYLKQNLFAYYGLISFKQLLNTSLFQQLQFGTNKIIKQKTFRIQLLGYPQSSSDKQDGNILILSYLEINNTKTQITQVKMDQKQQIYQSFQQSQFPAFPVVFQQQIQQKQFSRVKTGNKQGQKCFFRKFPQEQLNQLKQLLDSMKGYETKYSFLWTDELSKVRVQDFMTNTYKAFDEEFISKLIKRLQPLKLSRIGQHKVYIGKVVNNECTGQCVIMLKNGIIYEGQMVQNKRNGKGVYYDPNIGYYSGFFNKDIKQGQGVEILKDKTVYKGSFVNGLRHGSNGHYVDTNQNQYFGEWTLGIMHGKGFLKSKSSIFYGVFVNWLKHGQGQERFMDGDSYKGEYQNGRFDGFGTYRWANGSAIYQGSFRNGFRHGKGKWTQNQTKYLGSYVEGLKQGYGELYYPSGNFYKGNFANDKREGYGEMFWTDGSFYKGEWKNGVQNGKGQIYLTGSEIVSGFFQNSILVQLTQSNLERKPLDIENEAQFLHSQPRGIIGQRNRTFSENKGFNYNKKRLSKIDQTVRKPQYSVAKSKNYFKYPQKSDKTASVSKKKNLFGYQQSYGHGHGHGHGHGKQCKCVKRLQNFRLKQKVKPKIRDSRFNNINV